MISSRKFRSIVYGYFKKHGRHSLPWRQSSDAYRVMVSEIMLQQTQVERVIPKYEQFLRKFPTIKSLAIASLGDVLRAWQGLGYNRRAKMLHECAKHVVKEHGGVVPRTHEELCELPGIGPYTAGAIMAFAYNKPVSMIETNIRTVYLHHFFPQKKKVHDRLLLPLIQTTVDTDHPRMWYAALMDYGSYLKKTVGNVSRQSIHHTKQSAFKGSEREVRGAVIRAIAMEPRTLVNLVRETKHSKKRLMAQVERLITEGMVVRRNGRYMLP